MNPRATSVQALPDFRLRVEFANGEQRQFDARAYFAAVPALQRISNPGVFSTAYIAHGTVAWSDAEDICPDTLYLDSTPLHNDKAA